MKGIPLHGHNLPMECHIEIIQDITLFRHKIPHVQADSVHFKVKPQSPL